LASLIISGKNQSLTYQTVQKIVRHAPQQDGVDVLGPVVAPISKLRGKYRYRLLVKANKQTNIQNYLHLWMDGAVIPPSVDVRIDIDPYSFF
jgi:primosomal protein N' (replication factor Y)